MAGPTDKLSRFVCARARSGCQAGFDSNTRSRFCPFPTVHTKCDCSSLYRAPSVNTKWHRSGTEVKPIETKQADPARTWK